jgi:hypothetical protein
MRTALQPVLRLQASWAARTGADGALELLSIVQRRRARFRHSSAQLAAALALLGRGIPHAEALDVLAEESGLTRDEAGALLAELERLGVLIERDPEDDVSSLDGSTLYDRQIRFLSYYETDQRTGFDFNAALQDRTVMIVGIGGLGGWIALSCARLGIRRLVVVDPDTVELSNLHRQILYTRQHIGTPKVVASREALMAVDDIEVRGHEIAIEEPSDVVALAEGVDLVVNPLPRLPSFARASRAVADGALAAGVPCLHLLNAHCLGPLTLPGITACAECAWASLRARHELDAAVEAAEPESVSLKNHLAALAPRQLISAGLASWEVVRFLSRIERSPILDGVAWIDITRYKNHVFIPVTRAIDCPACGVIAPRPEASQA